MNNKFSYYKGSSIEECGFKDNLLNICNPYGYNIDSNYRDKVEEYSFKTNCKISKIKKIK